VGGEWVDVRVLVPPGSDAHTFAPTAADSAGVAKATLIFQNGLGFESWLDDLYAASGSTAKRLTLTDGLTLIQSAEGVDPHVWHDAQRAAQMVNALALALEQADPAHAETYRANATAYITQLKELDAWIVAQVNTVPPAQRQLVTTHDTFGYFAERYGFDVVGTILPTSTEGAAPSALALAALAEAMRASGVRAVFAENVASNSLLEQVAAEAGAIVVASLYTDALGPAGSEGETYLKMMRFNVATIVGALGGTPDQ
jgi:zinc/manganese transport system substrate-binding protein/manganese/iron transport system substrate-binding protein